MLTLLYLLSTDSRNSECSSKLFWLVIGMIKIIARSLWIIQEPSYFRPFVSRTQESTRSCGLHIVFRGLSELSSIPNSNIIKIETRSLTRARYFELTLTQVSAPTPSVLISKMNLRSTTSRQSIASASPMIIAWAPPPMMQQSEDSKHTSWRTPPGQSPLILSREWQRKYSQLASKSKNPLSASFLTRNAGLNLRRHPHRIHKSMKQLTLMRSLYAWA